MGAIRLLETRFCKDFGGLAARINREQSRNEPWQLNDHEGVNPSPVDARWKHTERGKNRVPYGRGLPSIRKAGVKALPHFQSRTSKEPMSKALRLNPRLNHRHQAPSKTDWLAGAKRQRIRDWRFCIWPIASPNKPGGEWGSKGS